MSEMICLLLAIVCRNEGNLNMFTGIVEEVGNVREIASGTLLVNAETILEALEVKDSICINGACLTVIRIDEHGFGVNVVPETLRRTDLGELSAGDFVNLERSVLLGGRLGGHIVQGHVDGTAEISSIIDDGDAKLYSFRIPKNVSSYVVVKGFICVDGISLTVVDCDENSFAVTLIPYTADHTVLGTKNVGDTVNIEVDIIAKYVEKLSNRENLQDVC